MILLDLCMIKAKTSIVDRGHVSGNYWSGANTQKSAFCREADVRRRFIREANLFA